MVRPASMAYGASPDEQAGHMPPPADTSAPMPDQSDTPEPPDRWRSLPIFERPGFLIRRLHQIHVALFAEECAGENITPVQYSVLTTLDHLGTADQTALAQAVGLDRTNIADVLARLSKRGLIDRRIASDDRRMRLATLTDAGRLTLERLAEGASRAHLRTIDALPPHERQAFIDTLKRLVDANNDVGRAPLRLS